MRLWVLGSGSTGNAVLVECQGSRVLVDAGFSPRVIEARLRTIGVAPASIEACVVTHEHADHVKGAAAGARRWGWKLFATAGTIGAWPELSEADCATLSDATPTTLSRMVALSFAVPHDAASPVGIRLACARTGASAVVCTDVGYASDSVRALCTAANLLVVESNHDGGMLRAGPYPPTVRARIASRTGHLSNSACAELARTVVHRDLAHVILAHLSATCNDQEIAYRTTADALRRSRFRGMLHVAMQDAVIGPFLLPGASTRQSDQYALAL